MQTIKARPTTYKGVQMRSRLEAGFAQWCDFSNIHWTYEPKAFASERGQYLPDFALRDIWVALYGAKVTCYVEVKPEVWPFDRWDEYETLLQRMAIIWESEPAAALVLAQPDSIQSAYWPSVSLLDRDVSPWDDPRRPWPLQAHWVCGPDRSIGIATPIIPSRTPWYGEWWKG